MFLFNDYNDLIFTFSHESIDFLLKCCWTMIKLIYLKFLSLLPSFTQTFSLIDIFKIYFLF